MQCNDIILGDTIVTSVDSSESNSVIRLSGANDGLLAQAINNYTYPKTVYGNSTDRLNAENILGHTGYNYQPTDSVNFKKPKTFTSNDIILGGPTATGISNDELNGATRLAGADRAETANLIRNYSTAKNIFGMSIDIQNAKRYLGTIEYNYIEIDQPGFIKPATFTSNDIILGGSESTHIEDSELVNGAKRLAGNNRYETCKLIREFAGTKYVIGADPDYTNAQSILGTTGGYHYQNTTNDPDIHYPLTSKNIILGGTKPTGITDDQLKGAIRLWGANTALTAQAINNYNSPRYVYGTKVDIDNAIGILGTTGHTFIKVAPNNGGSLSINSNDIVLGGSGDGGTGISDTQLNGAMRLYGDYSIGTADAVRNYFTSRNIYGVKIDIDNALGILGHTGYNYRNTDSIGSQLPTFTCNDIILGAIAYKVYLNGALNGATALTGSDAFDTANLVRVNIAGLEAITPNNGNNGDDAKIGVLSAKYESNGNPGEISNGIGDPGGKSYGAWQFNTKDGVIIDFYYWLKNINNGFYAQLNDAYIKDKNTNGANFDAAWEDIASQNHDTFLQLQHDYTKTQYYDIAGSYLTNKMGFDISKHSFALKNVLWSTAVQHGSGGAENIFGKVNLDASDADIINAIYDERSKVDIYFSASSQAVKDSIYNRFLQERADALNMLNN